MCWNSWIKVSASDVPSAGRPTTALPKASPVDALGFRKSTWGFGTKEASPSGMMRAKPGRWAAIRRQASSISRCQSANSLPGSRSGGTGS
ncbi:hypothetical protein BB31_20905 [Amycolatopsis lurida NRRL 2430]|uniref:Uncharacterized protein n=1 Tax=Amycolatopsis lurida NRRL 2430 TaxID=1460371 RepID=A0A2P2FRL6_AMYLU|nr:hypothetical protein BB31_20905 [Amycolatopsis lurida NRRL 2430]